MLKINDLHYNVEENGKIKEIIKGINLSFEDNKIYCITGPNGSGKSTLVKLIMGILTPSQGKIFLGDKDITDMTIDERARAGLSYAFQKPVTFKGLKVKDLLGHASGQVNNIGTSCEYLSEVGLCAKNYLDRPLDDKLSGGEQKRLELAMVLAKGGVINIFDEPEAGIDIWSFENLANIFSSLKNSINIIVSHQSKILELADEVIILSDGIITEKKPYKELKNLLIEKKCGKLNG